MKLLRIIGKILGNNGFQCWELSKSIIGNFWSIFCPGLTPPLVPLYSIYTSLVVSACIVHSISTTCEYRWPWDVGLYIDNMILFFHYVMLYCSKLSPLCSWDEPIVLQYKVYFVFKIILLPKICVDNLLHSSDIFGPLSFPEMMKLPAHLLKSTYAYKAVTWHIDWFSYSWCTTKLAVHLHIICSVMITWEKWNECGNKIGVMKTFHKWDPTKPLVSLYTCIHVQFWIVMYTLVNWENSV